MQTDALGGNAVVVYDRAADGSLRQAGTYPTGGVGGQLTGSVADHLASQGSLVYDKANALLYTVNAGSNTITVFSVHGDRLIRRQVISSGGTFPVSIAVRGNLVYVLNARDGGSVQGFVRIGATLVAVSSWKRPLGLNPAQTPEFVNTPGQLAFTPDGSNWSSPPRPTATTSTCSRSARSAGFRRCRLSPRTRERAVRGHLRRRRPRAGGRGGETRSPRSRSTGTGSCPWSTAR